MGADQHIDWHGQAASTLEWWADAGVDTLVEDEAFDWFARPAAPPSPAAVAAAQARIAAAPPATLDAFIEWRGGEQAPETGWNVAAVPIAVRADMQLMILTDLPEDGDSPESGWMTGTVGTLLDNMLAAIGLSRAEVTIAGIALARPLSGRIPLGSEAVLGDLARRLVTLLSPPRLLIFGGEARAAILGAQGKYGGLRLLNHGGIECPTIATLHPRSLLERPHHKGEAWRHLQLLIRETDA